MQHIKTFRQIAVVWAGLFALSNLGGRPQAVGADRFVDDPVEELRQVLKASTGTAAETEFRRRELPKKVDALQRIGDLHRAMMLQEWLDEGLDQPIKDIDAPIRLKLVKRFENAVRAILERGDSTSQLAAAATIGQLGVSSRGGSGPRGLVVRSLTGLARPLANLAKSDNPAIRAAVAQALSNVSPDPKIAVPTLGKLLQDKEVTVRRAAVTGLKNLIQPVTQLVPGKDRLVFGIKAARADVIPVATAVVPAVAVGLNDSDALVRRQSLTAIGQAAYTLGDWVLEHSPTARLTPLDRPLTEEEKSDAKDELRKVEEERNLAKVLGDQAPALTRVLIDPDPAVRVEARKALENMAKAQERLETRLAGEPAAEKVPAPKDTGREQEEPADKKAEDSSPNLLLKGLRTSLKELVAGIKDSDPEVRLRTIDVLETLGSEAKPVASSLVTALADSNQFVRWAAARTLGKIGPIEEATAVPALARLLEDPDLDLRLVAATALGRFGPSAQEAVPTLIQTVGRGDAEIRIAAMRALEGIGRKAAPAIPSITEALSQSNARVRQTAAEVLGRFGSLALGAEDALRQALDDKDPEVRKEASDALLNILPPALQEK